MSFFNTSDGQQIQSNQSFDLGGGDFDPIPNNTQLKSIIEEAKWDEYMGERYISLKWNVIDGEYKSRKIFQKIRVLDTDSKKSDKAKNMLAAIDANAGGKILSKGVEPTDMDLSLNLCAKPMAIVVAIWEIDGKKGNWVKAVAPLKQSVAQTTPQQTPDIDFDDDVDF